MSHENHIDGCQKASGKEPSRHFYAGPALFLIICHIAIVQVAMPGLELLVTKPFHIFPEEKMIENWEDKYCQDTRSA